MDYRRNHKRRENRNCVKWIYRHPVLYDLLDSIVNIGFSDRARTSLVNFYLKEQKVLEVGIGSGKSIKSLKGEEFFGVDNSIFMLRRVKRYTRKLCVASAYNLPFKPHSFDVVLFIYTLRTLRDQEKAIAEALKAGDKIIILEFKPLPKLFELLGKKVFGSSEINKNFLPDFSHKSYLNRFDIYYNV